MTMLREITGHPRCIGPVDCQDWVYEPLWNDIVDRTNHRLASGNDLCSGKGTRINGQTIHWFGENFAQHGYYSSAPFELCHGQNRFRLLTSGQIAVQTWVNNPQQPFPSTHSTSIAFKVFNISQGTEAIICQIYKNKAQFDACVAASQPPLPSIVTPVSVAPYIVDLDNITSAAVFNLSFEQQWPDDIYPIAGQSDVCELRVIFSAANPTAPFGQQYVNYFDLKQILEPTV